MTASTAIILRADDLQPAVDAIRAGDVVGMPTETVYGLAGDAFNPVAVTKIFSAKERPSFDPLIVHVASNLNSVDALAKAGIVDASAVTENMTAITDRLIKLFWPGPLTLVLPKSKQIPDLVTSGLERVGIRMPAHPVAQNLLRQLKCPLAAPSANRFGRISPTTAAHVLDELGDRIPYIIDGGPCDIGVESTVVAIDDNAVWLLRPGKISAAALHQCTGVPVSTAPSEHAKASPGMLASHYAPQKPLYVLPDFSTASSFIPLRSHARSFALMITDGTGDRELKQLAAIGLCPVQTVVLSAERDDRVVARKLFAAMRQLDASPAEVMITNEINDSDGLWPAVADRIRRASTKFSSPGGN